MSKDVLDEIVAVLVTGNVDEWYAWTIVTTFANTIKVSAEEFDPTNLKALLNDFGCELIHTVLRCITNDMVNSAAAISWCTMLADVLDAPITELAMSNNVDTGKYFLNAWTL